MKRFLLRWGLALILIIIVPVSLIVVCTTTDPLVFFPSHRQKEMPIPEGTQRNPYIQGGYRPVLRVNGTTYHWDGIHTAVYNELGQDLHRALKDKPSYLPEGFTQAGSITWVGDDAPAADLQLQAGFEASGTVYVSPGFPEVTYIRLKARWFDRGEEVVRFTTEELGQRICWQGRQYRFTGVDRDTVDTLPEGCTSMGLLQFVTRDSIPAENLHTNVPWLARHEIFADGQKPQVLYVADTWGEHHQWYRCRLWEDWTDEQKKLSSVER